MLTIRKYGVNGYRDLGRNIVRRFKYVYFGTLRGRCIAIVSNVEIPFRGPYTNVRVVEDRKIPLYKASMMMQMGKRFSDVESVTVAMGIFDLQPGYLDGFSYEVYTAQKWGY